MSTDREQLIEEAAKAIQDRAKWPSLHWPDPRPVLAHRDVARALAETAFAVFEKAHTPQITDEQRQTLADGKHHALAFAGYENDQDALIARLVDALETALRQGNDGERGVTPTVTCGSVHTPTDDEREALAMIIEPYFDRAVDYDDGSRDDEGLRDEILAAGFRRTVHGEPSDEQGVTLEAYDGGVQVSDAGGASFWIAPRVLAALRAAGVASTDSALRERVQQLVDNQQSWIDAGRSGQAISRDAMRDVLQRVLDETRGVVSVQDEPEPDSAPVSDVVTRGTFGHVWPCPLFYVGNWRHIENGYKPAATCSNPKACAVPTPVQASEGEGHGA